MPPTAYVLMATWASVLGLRLVSIRLPCVAGYLGHLAVKALTAIVGHPGLAGFAMLVIPPVGITPTHAVLLDFTVPPLTP